MKAPEATETTRLPTELRDEYVAHHCEELGHPLRLVVVDQDWAARRICVCGERIEK